MSNRMIAVVLCLFVFSVGAYVYWKVALTKPVPLRIGYFASAYCAPYWIAYEKGFYKGEGLNVTLTKFQTGARMVEAIAAGSLDLGFVPFSTSVNAYLSGIDIRIATDGGHSDQDHEGGYIVVGRDSGIESIADLRGKNFGLMSRGGLGEVVLRFILRNYNLTIDDVNIFVMPSETLHLALLSGRIDAGYLIEPYLTHVMDTGNYTKLSRTIGSFFPDHKFLGGSALFLKEFLDQNKEAVDAFIRAYARAVDWMNENPEATRVIISKYTGLDLDFIARSSAYAFDRELDRELVDRCLDLLWREGFVDRRVKAEEIMYTP